MSDHHDARILELEKQIEQLRSALDDVVIRVEDHRIEQLKTEHDHTKSIALLKSQFEELHASFDQESVRNADHRKYSFDADSEHLKIINMVNARLSANIDITIDLDSRLRADVVDLAGVILLQDENVRKHRMKIDELYYHVFPDRVEKDAAVVDQMEKLGLNASADVGPKIEWEARISKALRDASPKKE